MNIKTFLKGSLKTSLFTSLFLAAYFIPLSITTYNTDIITLQNGNHTIVVQGMIHSAPKKFYELTEDNIYKYKNKGYKYYYEQVVGTQAEKEEFNKLNNNLIEIAYDISNSLGFDNQNNYKISEGGTRADTDLKTVIKDYKKYDIKLISDSDKNKLIKIKETIKETNYFEEVKQSRFQQFYLKALMRYSLRVAEFFGGKENFEKHIVNKRNDILLNTIDYNNNTFITYGQLHLDDIVEKLEKKGYKVVESDKVEVF